jgi:hypothetical protein
MDDQQTIIKQKEKEIRDEKKKQKKYLSRWKNNKGN